jgi:predicted HNH restriction endonuclease
MKLKQKNIEKFNLINIHYRREKEDYADWKLYVYKHGYPGVSYNWISDHENPGYVHALISFELNSNNADKLWFKVYKGNWEEEDVIIDRAIK